jgi:hypothetical protein
VCGVAGRRAAYRPRSGLGSRPLAKKPDIAAAEVKYANNLTSSGTAYVNITVKAGARSRP